MPKLLSSLSTGHDHEALINLLIYEEITDSIPQRSDEYIQTEQSTILPFNKPASTHFFMVLLSGIEPISNYRYKKAESDIDIYLKIGLVRFIMIL
ncbi:hypothetical protein ACNARU_16770 [Proteus sp. WDL240414]|uniref:hypothetical protein n=1 Tax=Proteus TaxID=583 RepID=UPI000D69704B|nr:hypothetical protein [Proteus genomosp. 6]